MDATTDPLLAKGGTQTARLWTYVIDDQPLAEGAPPAALFHFSRDRKGIAKQCHKRGPPDRALSWLEAG